MARFNVRSNCITPFAWSRMIGSMPQDTEALRARVDKIKEMTPEKIAPMCVFLLSDAAKDVTGQIFGVRNNEIFLMGQSRPLRSVHRGEGWTPESVAEHAIPAMKSHFYPLDRSEDSFSWDPGEAAFDTPPDWRLCRRPPPTSVLPPQGGGGGWRRSSSSPLPLDWGG